MRLFLLLVALFAAIIVGTEIGLGLWLRQRRLLVVATPTFAYGLLAVVLRARLSRARIAAIALWMCSGLLALGLSIALLLPAARMAVALVPLLAVAIAFPYLDGPRLRALLVAALLVNGVIGWVCEFLLHEAVAPPWTERLIALFGLVAASLLVLLLLSHFSDRLRANLARVEGANQTLRDAQAELQRAVVLREEFVAIASHELRTPLTPLRLYMQAMRRTMEQERPAAALVEQLRAGLAIGERQVERLAHLVEVLLDPAHRDADALRIEPEALDLVELVREVAERHAPEAARAGSSLALDLPARLSGHWDRARLDQMVTNLLHNALKYGAGAAVDISVAAGDGVAKLMIRDHGIGIAAPDQERIFAKYERAVSAQNYGGFGLGLFIVRRIVAAHGGTIDVRSALGAGSTFTVTLPLRP